jgi:HSP20 family protein
MAELSINKRQSETQPATRSQENQGLSPFSRGLPFGLDPFGMMREFAGEMDRVFRGGSQSGETQAWAPRMDVQQCGGNLVVSAELPGLKREDVKVEVNDDALTIQGERKQEHSQDHDGYHRWERSYGRFYRAIPLPQGANTDQIKAELKDGLLKVSIPVPDAAKKAKQIPVAG